MRHSFFYYLLNLREKIKGLVVLINSFENWYDFIPVRFNITNSVVLRTRDKKGQMSQITIDNHKKTLTVQYNKNNISFNIDSKRQLENTLRNVYQTFMQEQYNPLNVRKKRVVDIGANNGDTAMYFVVCGATYVYAYEPFPYTYNLAVRNLRTNRMQNKVDLMNEAVLDKQSKISVDDNYDSTSNSMLQASDSGKRIKVVGLDYITKKHELRHAVLKMDCEGSEYSILLNASDETLKRFDQIAIEYHFGYEKLVSRLRGLGFKVRYTGPKIGRNSETNGVRMIYGMIYAHK